jgi:hypothetical protein
MHKALLASLALLAVSACDSKQQKRADHVKLLATDVHLDVGQQAIALPFVALEDYASRRPSFSLRSDPPGSRRDTANALIESASQPQHPHALRQASISIAYWGAADFNTQARDLCPRLTREWAKDVCGDPFSPILQALPPNRFKLIDLSRFDDDSRRAFNCAQELREAPVASSVEGEASIVCRREVLGSDRYHTAAVRISGDLGATWAVADGGATGESKEDQLAREARAIIAFVTDALGPSENYERLLTNMCSLRRPKSLDFEGLRCPPS